MDDSDFFKRLFKWIGKGIKAIGRGVKKVGQAVWKGVKKIAPILKKVAPLALLGAAAFFTFGGALGITAGWATKIGGLVSKLGISGKMGNIISGAIVQAGRGALIGGITGAATGQGFMKGAQFGALGGAVTGGVLGAFQPVGAAAATGGSSAAKTAAQSSFRAGELGGTIPGEVVASQAAQAAAPVGTSAMPTAISTAFRASSPSALERVWSTVVGSGGLGPIIQGVGGGLSRGLEARSMERQRDERRASYDIDYGSSKPRTPMFRRVGDRLVANYEGA